MVFQLFNGSMEAYGPENKIGRITLAKIFKVSSEIGV